MKVLPVLHLQHMGENNPKNGNIAEIQGKPVGSLTYSMWMDGENLQGPIGLNIWFGEMMSFTSIQWHFTYGGPGVSKNDGTQ